jgi:hypothetical protein
MFSYRYGACFVHTLCWISAVPGIVGAISLYTMFPIPLLFGMSLLSLLALKSLKDIVYPEEATGAWTGAVANAFLFTGLFLGVAWISWLVMNTTTIPDWNNWTDWNADFRDMVSDYNHGQRGNTSSIDGQRGTSWKIAFIAWAMPFFIAFELLFIAAMQHFRKLQIDDMENLRDHSRLSPDEQTLIGRVKQISVLIAGMAMALWILASVQAAGDATEFDQERADMSSDVIVLLFLICVCVLVWVSYVLGKDKVVTLVQSSKVIGSIFKLLQSDWAHACVVFIPILPLFCIPRHAREYIMTWNWKEVLVKVMYLGLLYFLFEVGFTKATKIVLAYINMMLVGVSLYIVTATVFLVGFVLFMLPPTPGAPVYMIVGIIIVRTATEPIEKGGAGWTFAAGASLAIGVGFAVKIAFAAAAQKWIGAPMGNNASIRHTCQIHTMEMRAFEMVVSSPGCTPAKVAVLIGGPDWPMAVICGILQLPLAPVLLAVSPVLFQSVIPCVLSGALLSAKSEGLREVGSTCLAIAAFLQVGAGLVFGYYLQQIIEKHADELSVPRERDKDLLLLDKKEAAKAQSDAELVSWPVLPCVMKCILIFGVLLSQGMFMVFFAGDCFRKFAVDDSIEEKLDGNPLNMIKRDGWVGMTLFAGAMFCLVAYEMWESCVLRGNEVGDSDDWLEENGDVAGKTEGKTFD